jgi:hypothetical protein
MGYWNHLEIKLTALVPTSFHTPCERAEAAARPPEPSVVTKASEAGRRLAFRRASPYMRAHPTRGVGLMPE